MKVYQYAVHVPDVFSQEFANIGILLFSPDDARFKFHLNKRTRRLSEFFCGSFDAAAYRAMRDQMEQAVKSAIVQCERCLNTGQVNGLDELLPLILPHDASSFQWSVVVGGINDEPLSLIKDLVQEMLPSREHFQRDRMDAKAIWTSVRDTLESVGIKVRALKEQALVDHQLSIREAVPIEAQNYDYVFRGGWRNGCLQVMEPISFDYLNATEIKEHANVWTGRLTNLVKARQKFQVSAIVQGPVAPGLQNAYRQAKEMLEQAPAVRLLVSLEEFGERMVPLIRKDLESTQAG